MVGGAHLCLGVEPCDVVVGVLVQPYSGAQCTGKFLAELAWRLAETTSRLAMLMTKMVHMLVISL